MHAQPSTDNRPIIAEIISTGNEVLSGAVMDSNAAFIARQLHSAGVHVERHVCVGDELSSLNNVLIDTSQRADLAVVTGGLGPTHDDITAAAAANAAGSRLELNEPALESMQRFFDRRRLTMTPTNEKQARLPNGARCLENPIGTAPGFELRINRCRFFFLPGVPAEMRRMMTDQVLPAVLNRRGGGGWMLREASVVIFGMTESAVAEKLSPYQAPEHGVGLGVQASFPEIRVRAFARGTDAATLDERISETVERLRETFGRLLVSVKGDSMQTVVGELLKKRKATVAVAESCTGGLIAHKLTQVSGSSDYFLLAAVTYANAAKIEVLGVSPQTLKRYGAVDEHTAGEMADGARRLAKSDYAVATTGIAGPSGGSGEKPVGTVCIGLATPHETRSRRFHFNFGDRAMNKTIFAVAALDMLRRRLMDGQ